MSDIYLIRHGQASFGEENYDRLSPTGIRQARIAGRHHARVGRLFDALYSGRQERQRSSAAEFRRGYRENGLELPEPVQWDAFDEYDSQAVWQCLLPVLLEENPGLERDVNRLRDDRGAFQRLFAQVISRWLSFDEERPGMPRWVDFKCRVRRGFERLMAAEGRKKTIAVFTSGGPIAVAVQMALGIPDAMAIELNWRIMNASVTRLKYSGRGVVLDGFNEVAHLELEGETELLTYR